ncbi:MAG TPA: SigE family RNA polymerase sigma factor [Actinomycetota bacterium]|nr:SigE family RNA polymerase sigma factor [Actinomycetota bacterium]
MRERPPPIGAAEVPAFEDFYRKEYRAVVGLAYALSGSRWAAEDLAQDAFLAAHDRWDRISGYDQPGAWVRRVVANRSVSAIRRRNTEAKTMARMAFGERPALAEIPNDAAEFWDAVRSLPRRQAQVVALHYLEDRPIAEIAEILGIAAGTVKKHLFDGRQTLARELGLDEEDER